MTLSWRLFARDGVGLILYRCSPEADETDAIAALETGDACQLPFLRRPWELLDCLARSEPVPK